MRWLITQPGPEWSVHDVFVGWAEALRELGQDVHEFNLADRLALYDHAFIDIGDAGPNGELRLRKALTADQAKELAVNGLAAALFKVRPHFLFVICGFLIPDEILDQARRYGTRVIIMHTEEPYETGRELALAEHADLNMINDPTHLDRFPENTIWAPHAYRPSVHHPLGTGTIPDSRLISRFAFVGTGFGSRRWFFERMHATGVFDHIDVLLAGNWHGLTIESPLWQYLASGDPEKCCDNDRTADIYRAASAGINLYRRESDDGSDAVGYAMGPREVEMAACGLFFLRDPRPEGDALFPMLPTFADPESAAEVLTWWLAHPGEREEAANAAREAIVDRTFIQHARSLLRLLETRE